MKPTSVIAVDQGTTSTRVIAFDVEDFQMIAVEQLEFTQYFPKAGYVEHDLDEIWNKTKLCLEKICTILKEKNYSIASIGITNQRETVGFWDRSTGRPLTHALVWQDRRTSEFCHQHKAEFAIKWSGKCGLPLDPYFSASKISWVLNHVPEVKTFAAQNSDQLCIGTIDSFLLFKLTHHEVFATDVSNASRTLLFELEGKSWSDGLCQFFSVEKTWLPEIKDSLGLFGKTKNVSKLIPNDIAITAIIGDQQSALFAQGCIERGEMKCTYGTGAFLLAHTGDKPQISKHGLLTTVALQYGGKRFFALEGACFIAGAALQWLRDGLKIIDKSSEIETLASQITVEKNSLMQELYFLPFFTGIGAPRWVSDAKGTIWGIERGTTKQHIAKACLEGIVLSIDDLVNALEFDLGHKIIEMRVDGGATANQLLMRMQSLISKRAVILPKNSESTALGAAAGAWMAVNNWPLSKIKDFSKVSKKVEFNESDPEANYFQMKRTGWKKILDRLYNHTGSHS